MRAIALAMVSALLLSGCAIWDWKATGRTMLKSICFAYSSVDCEEKRDARRP